MLNDAPTDVAKEKNSFFDDIDLIHASEEEPSISIVVPVNHEQESLILHTRAPALLKV